MTTETWFRNPYNYVREMVEIRATNIAWDRGILVKKSIDPYRFASLHFGHGIPWRALLVGDQGAAELDQAHDITKPRAVYPVWEYGTDIEILQEIVQLPIGEDEDMCGDMTLPPDERPVFGQPHRVVIIGCPPAGSGPGRRMMRILSQMQSENMDCIIHVHGLYGYRVAFGLGFGAADVDPRMSAQKGKVILPMGKEMPYEHTVKLAQWVTLLGMRPVDLKVPRNRCIYNMKSALWAGENYDKNIKFRVKDGQTADKLAENPKQQTVSATNTGSTPAKVGDKFLCNTCSIQNSCKYFRAGAVCSIPGSQPVELARFFQTRDSDRIIDGLGTLLAAQSRRLEKGMDEEEEYGELDPEVTKILNSLFGNGVKLAKLVNPSLNGGPKVGVFVNAGSGAKAVASSDAQTLTARAVASLEAQGISRDKITPEMIMGLLDPDSENQHNRAIAAGQVIDVEEADDSEDESAE
jgi:hypothetical protein